MQRLIKFKLLFSSLIIVALVLTIKLVCHFYCGFEGYVKLADITLVLTAGIFLTGFMLSGVLSDFKESEKIPAEIAGATENIYDMLSMLSNDAKLVAIDFKNFRQKLKSLNKMILAYIYGEINISVLITELNATEELITSALHNNGVPPPIVIKTQNEFQAMRKAINRMNVIATTGFMPAGYAFLEAIIALILMLLLVTKYESTFTEVLITSFVTMLYVYVYKMINDIDNPFEYTREGAAGCAEVDIQVLRNYSDMLDEREK